MRLVSIGEICALRNGRAFKPSEWSTSGTPIIRIQNLTDDTKPFNYCEFEVDSKFHVENGNLLFSWSGTPGTSFGAFFWRRERGYLNQHIFRIDPYDPGNLNLEYFRLALNSKLEEIINQAHGGVGLQHITKEKLNKVKVYLPEFNDQLRIAHLLGKVEGLIAQRKQHLQQLDDLLKSAFLEMFGDPVRNEKGWVPTTIGDNVEIQSGQVDPRKLPYSELPHVGGANIESESGNLVELKQAKYENLISGKYIFDSTYILYSKIRPYLNKVSKPDFQGICSADIYPIKPIDGLLNRDFLRMLLMSKGFLSYTANNSDRANIPKINRKALVAFGFNRPQIDVQNQFAVIVKKVEVIKSQYQQSLTELETLYGALSQKAFKGDLDLSRVPLPSESKAHAA
ncbi:MAG: restriction endonuclease subunit S [Halothiobacillus sp.]|nr:restriction endonuclease subunit S [Halothiobacillus sp.]